MSALRLLGLLVVLAGAGALFGAGYLFGARRGNDAREALRDETTAKADEAAALAHEATLAKARLAEELERREDPLRADLQRVLTPLLERERINNELSNLDGQGNGHRRDLAALLDQIARRGNFASVVLHDEDGWPLAASGNTEDLDRLGATASLLLLLADRLGRDSDSSPLSVMVHNSANHVTLSRLFVVSGQRLSLTVVAAGTPVTPTTLDPALVSISAALTGSAPSV